MLLYTRKLVQPSACPSSFPSRAANLVLLGAGSLHALVLSRQNGGAAVDAAERLGDDGRAVCADRGADGHEEATEICK